MPARMSTAERERLRDQVDDTIRWAEEDDPLPWAEVSQWTLDDIKSYLESRGLKIDVDKIVAAVEQEIGIEGVDLERGDALSDDQKQRLQDKLQRAVVSAARVVAKQTIRAARQAALDEADDREPWERMEVWVAKLRRSCRSCEELHGEIKSADQWDDIGRPGDGKTLCGMNCECSTVPVEGATHEDTLRRLDEMNQQTPRRRALAAEE